ncbi:yemanuclein isoform X2 [Musca autumnalis]|uniref:yemanuclein isoform X2 n=2 Tax=Musca autumnalis TaxID=221902 RepID=UPI003CF61396
MSEAKRVTLTTISSTVSSSILAAGSSRFGADFLAPAEKPSAPTSSNKNGCKTLRLNVELFQTDCNQYPEFDYSKLVHVEKKKLKKLKQKTNGFSDPFEDNDDDVARIAKELERKYGNAYVSGRGKNKRDDIDIGMGYDESDSFIDNTEAYDEMVPDEVETIEGGFYINCGALEFKKLHTESTTTKTDEIIKMPNRPKKAIISSSSEDSSSSDDDDDEEDEEDDSDDDEDDEEEEDSAEEASVETAKSKSSSSAAPAVEKKSKVSLNSGAKKKASNPPTENGGSKTKKLKIKNVTSGVSSGSSSNSPKPVTDDLASDSEKERLAKKIEKTTTVKDMLKAQRDNFLKSQTTNDVKSSGTGNGKVKGKSSSGDDDDDDEDSSDDSDEDDDGEESDNSDSNQSAPKTQTDKKSASSNDENPTNEKLRSSDSKLPDLEPDVLASVVEFRDGLKAKNMLGKKLQFDDRLSESFLKIDDALLCIDKADRSVVYAHLEYQLLQPKYFFLRKARQLREKEEKLKTKRAFNKLQKAVTETMPLVISSYDAELRRYAELQAGNVNSDQPPKMPKKKFPWNPNLRNLLYDVYQVRWTSYPVLGKKKETLEDFITSYMSKKVVEIWPKGWMRYEELQKEIERRKNAVKKAKEKEKSKASLSSAQNAVSSVQPTTTSSSTLANPPPETNPPRSNANSDTDSVASSSNTSSSLKRKNTDTNPSNKQVKAAKAAKLNGEQQKSANTKNMPAGLDLTSPNKKSDHSINHIISPTSMAASAAATSSIFSATVAALSQPLKHSNNTHVIDLDNYTCPNEIMQQAAAANAALASYTMTNTTTSSVSRRESSGADSEIEIVGYYPAKINANKKQKTNSRSSTPNSNQPGTEKTYNNNNNKNTKKQPPNATLTSGALNLLGVEGYNKMVNAFMDLGEHLQVQPILSSSGGGGAATASANQQQSRPSTSSSPMPSNMPHQ